MPPRTLHIAFLIGFAAIPQLAAETGAETSKPASSEREQYSDSFIVRTYPGGPDARQVLALAAEVRRKAHRLWIADEPAQPWRPRCEIVLHPGRASYLGAVGFDGGQTSGASLVKRVEGKTVKRRVDLLVDQQGHYPALSHELTHVVIADFFEGRVPPPWVDEGIATIADLQKKRALHRRDCRLALQNGSAMDLAVLLEVRQIASRDQIAAFYGQSLSLVEFLANRREPTRVLALVELAHTKGYDEALRDIYGIDGVGDLQHQWLQYEKSNATEEIQQVALSP